MDPYLTHASRLRAAANDREIWSDRCDGQAESYEGRGRVNQACEEYRVSAIHLREAASILREAAAVDGGTQADLDRADLLTRAADHRQRWAANLSG